MPKLEILVGMIASGKSTYAANRADQGALVISHDDLTEMLHARYRCEAGLELQAMYRRMEGALALIALDFGRDVIIDNTHLTAESRRRWIDFEYSSLLDCHEIVAVVFPVEFAETHALRRFDADPRGRSLGEWTLVAEHHHAQADPVGDDEGFCRIRFIEDISQVHDRDTYVQHNEEPS